MDTKLSIEVIKKRKKTKILKLLIIIVSVAIASFGLFLVLQPKISIDDLRVATVDRGDINVSVSAIGRVIPAYEEIITSPVSSKIINVYKSAGDLLEAGDTIIGLDLEEFNVKIQKERDEVMMQETKIKNQRISNEGQIQDFAMQFEIAEMKLDRMKMVLNNERYLDSLGASTSDKIRQLELDFKVQSLQLDQLKIKHANLINAQNIALETLERDYDNALKVRTLSARKLFDAEVRAPQNGTLTWVNDQIGSPVSEGQKLAVLSDLENYKIEGEIVDSYSDRIHIGDLTQVKISDLILDGTISNIFPSVQEGLIKFTVILAESNNKALRSGLRVELYVTNSVISDVLRINIGSYFHGKGEYELWVINDGKLVKRLVKLGESSYDKVEVIDGLNQNDRVVISDMSKFKQQTVLKL